jgi:hypothetical protein
MNANKNLLESPQPLFFEQLSLFKNFCHVIDIGVVVFVQYSKSLFIFVFRLLNVFTAFVKSILQFLDLYILIGKNNDIKLGLTKKCQLSQA